MQVISKWIKPLLASQVLFCTLLVRFIAYKEPQSLFCVDGDVQHWIYGLPA